MAAAYECTISLTDDETFLFRVEPRDSAGNPPVWAEYQIEYALTGCGQNLRLTVGAGIEVDDEDCLIIGPADRSFRLKAGTYQHGLRLRHIATNVTVQQFDGTVTVTEGNFR